VSQPAVSKAISELEATLGVRLLNRGPGGVEPTAYGLALIRRGEAAFDELRQGIQELEFLANPTRGEVRMGCPESMAAALIPAALERFLRDHPGMVVHVAQAQTVTLEFRELRERRVDFMLGRIARPFREDDLAAEILFDEQLHVVAGARSRWAGRRKVRLEELAGERWILTPPNNVVDSTLDEAFRARGLDAPRPTVVSFSFHLRRHLLTTEDFLTVMPGSMLRFYNAKQPVLKALPVDAKIRPQPIAVVTLKNREPAPAVRLFIDRLREEARSKLL
jgi:DNA-binding transcriptional LysR family regulator